mgnify:FL=1
MLFVAGFVIGGMMGMLVTAICTISEVEARVEEALRDVSHGQR